METSTAEPLDATITSARAHGGGMQDDADAQVFAQMPTPSPLQFRDRERYVVLGEHGRGGLGRVSRAHDRELGRDVAIKELLRRGYAGEARFFREALITARLEHPGIVPVHEAGRWSDGTPFYAMKLVAGRPLKELLDEAPGLPERLALLPCVTAVAEAIAYAHDRRIIHRDLKPANVIIGQFGEAVVIDWGLAKDLTDRVPEAPHDGPYRSPSDEGLTAAGSTLGTPAYMAPEQHQGIADERSDVYALGGMLHHLLTGVPPHGSTTDSDAGSRAAHRSALAGDLDDAAPRDLVAIAARALAPTPADRYASMSALAGDLKRYREGRLVSVRTYPRAELLGRWIRRHRAIVALGALASVILVFVAAIAVRRILVERDLAGVARGVAERARDQAFVARNAAEVALRGSERARDELVLTNARSALVRDPTATLAWLKTYAGPDAYAVRDLAATAIALGVARQTLIGTSAAYAVASPTDGMVLSASTDRTLRAWNLADGSHVVVRADLAESSPMAVSVTGDVVFVSTDGHLQVYHPPSGRFDVRGRVTAVENLAFVDRDTVLVHESSPPFLRLVSLGSALAVPQVEGAAGPLGTSLVSTDGRWVAACSHAGTLQLWRVGTRRAVHRGTCLETLWPLAFAADGRALAIVTPRGTSILDTRTGRARPVTRSAQRLKAVALSRSGRFLVDGSDEGRVRVFDSASGAELASWQHGGAITRLGFSGDEQTVISASYDGTARLHPMNGGSSVQLRGHRDTVFDYTCLTTTCSRLTTASADGTLRDWTIPITQRERLSNGASLAYNATYAGPNRIVGTFRDGSVNAWTNEGGRWTPEWLARHPASAWNVVSSSDGTLVVTGDHAGGIAVSRRGEGSRYYSSHSAAIYALALTRDERTVVSASADGEIHQLELGSGASQVLGRHAEGAYRLLVLDATGEVVSSGDDGTVARWGAQVSSGRLRTFVAHKGFITSMIALGGARIATLGEDGTLRLWDLDGNGHEDRIVVQRDVQASSMLECDGRIVSGWRDGILRLDDPRGGTASALSLTPSKVSALDCAPRSRKLVVATEDGRLRLFDLATGGERLLIASNHGGINSVQFSADEQTLLTTTLEGVVELSKVPTDDYVPLRAIEPWLRRATTATTKTLMEEMQ